ncbi:pyridoxamine 5'-phosphate oxidase family protein [Embleya sp. NPDC050493]|uniref:pyridoxamine 5'-phosphate oxidase family protein n=1 Tax=Embleya sp. NPDC050493 TaxID=3363989 RepID=UPI0037A8CEB7
MSDYPVTKRPLDRRETLELMAGAQVGRVVVSEGALPAVYLVTFALDRECVVFRASADSALAKAALETVVAFQADQVDHVDRSARTGWTGWTGTVTGHASRVRDPAAVAHLDQLLPEADGDGAGHVWFRVTSELVTGHLVQRAGDRSGLEPDAPRSRTTPPG